MNEAIKMKIIRLHKWQKQAYSQRIPPEKNSELADKFRVEGHNHYLRKEYSKSIDLYNQSMCLASDKKQVSLCLGHRAESFFKLNLFRESLSSIELALQYSYPEDIKDRMLILRKKCQDALSGQSLAVVEKVTCELSHPPHPNRPWMINDLQMGDQRSELITEVDLSLGDLIAIEEPYLRDMNPVHRYRRCSSCFSFQRHLLFPCSFCPNVMFCSQKCEKDSWTVFHRYECGISHFLVTVEPAVRLSLRALLVGLHLFKDFATIERYLEKPPTEVDLEGDDKERFLAYINLLSDAKPLASDKRIEISERATELQRFLRLDHDLSQRLDTENNEEFLFDFLCLCIRINMARGCMLNSSEEDKPIGFGIYLESNLFPSLRHGGNVKRLQRDWKRLWIVTKGIKRGSKLFF